MWTAAARAQSPGGGFTCQGGPDLCPIIGTLGNPQVNQIPVGNGQLGYSLITPSGDITPNPSTLGSYNVSGLHLGIQICSTSPCTAVMANVQCAASNGPIIIQLPGAAGTGFFSIIAKTDTTVNSCTVKPASSDLINGSSTPLTLLVPNQTVQLIDRTAGNWQANGYAAAAGGGLSITGTLNANNFSAINLNNATLVARQAPANLTLTSTCTGACSTAYSYEVSCLGDSGQTQASNPAVTSNNLPVAGNSVTVQWNAEPGCYNGYDVYGRVAGSIGLIGTTTSTSFVDTGSVVPGAAPPAANTTGTLKAFNVNGNVNGVLDAVVGGADPTGTVDSSGIFTFLGQEAALDHLAIHIPAGTYRISSVNWTNLGGLVVYGDDSPGYPTIVSQLFCQEASNNSGLCIDMSGSYYTRLDNFTIAAFAGKAPKALIYMAKSTAGIGFQHDWHGLTFNQVGGDFGLYNYGGGEALTCDNCYFNGTPNKAMVFTTVNNSPGFVSSFISTPAAPTSMTDVFFPSVDAATDGGTGEPFMFDTGPYAIEDIYISGYCNTLDGNNEPCIGDWGSVDTGSINSLKLDAFRNETAGGTAAGSLIALGTTSVRNMQQSALTWAPLSASANPAEQFNGDVLWSHINAFVPQGLETNNTIACGRDVLGVTIDDFYDASAQQQNNCPGASEIFGPFGQALGTGLKLTQLQLGSGPVIGTFPHPVAFTCTPASSTALGAGSQATLCSINTGVLPASQEGTYMLQAQGQVRFTSTAANYCEVGITNGTSTWVSGNAGTETGNAAGTPVVTATSLTASSAAQTWALVAECAGAATAVTSAGEIAGGLAGFMNLTVFPL